MGDPAGEHAPANVSCVGGHSGKGQPQPPQDPLRAAGGSGPVGPMAPPGSARTSYAPLARRYVSRAPSTVASNEYMSFIQNSRPACLSHQPAEPPPPLESGAPRSKP